MIVWWKTVIFASRHCEITLKKIRPISNYQCDSAVQVSQRAVWCICYWLRVAGVVARCELGWIVSTRCLWMLMHSFVLWELLEFHLSFNSFSFLLRSRAPLEGPRVTPGLTSDTLSFFIWLERIKSQIWVRCTQTAWFMIRHKHYEKVFHLQLWGNSGKNKTEEWYPAR